MPENVVRASLTERELDVLRLLGQARSNREIANELALSVGTVKWYARQIYNKLGVSTREDAAARARALDLLGQETELEPLVGDSASVKHNLPAQITSFVGRQRELVDVKELMAHSRLLTLTGPGGTGKTRLAVQAAAEMVEDFPDGVYVVAMDRISSAALVPTSIAQVLNICEVAGEPLSLTLQYALRDKHMLLVLDNFEHVIDAAPLVVDLLRAAPHLKVMATSRHVLHLYGEQEFAVPPLAVPVLPDGAPLHTIADYEAVALFVQRARSIHPDFELTPENANTIAAICARLDGLPLAIELAAARTRLFSPQALLERLDSRLGMLVGSSLDLPDRQRTLRDAIDWSYNLLGPCDQMMFDRLAVFSGGSALDAIEAVCSVGVDDVIESLGALVDHSLMRQESGLDREPRFVMLDTLREYAVERLDRRGEQGAIRARHADYYAELARHGDQGLAGRDQVKWLARLGMEHDNLRAALNWTLEDSGDPALGLHLAARLGWFWFLSSASAEGRRWCTMALAANPDAPPDVRAKVLTLLAGRLASNQAVEPGFRAMLEEARTLAEKADDPQHQGWATGFLGVHLVQADIEHDASAQFEEALALFRTAKDRMGIAWVQNLLGEMARLKGDYSAARQYYEDGLAEFQALGNQWGISLAWHNLGWALFHLGEHEAASRSFREALLYELKLGRGERLAYHLIGLAAVAQEQGNLERAACLLGAADSILADGGIHLYPSDRLEYERSIIQVRERLDKDAYMTAWTDGFVMTVGQAVDFALS